MKYLVSVLILSLFVSCASKRRSEGKSVSNITNEDFKKEPAISFSEKKDFYDLSEINDITDDSLINETIQRVPEAKLEAITADQSSADPLSRLSSLCYQKEFRSAFILIDKVYRPYKKNAAYWNQVGTCYFLKGDYRKSRLFYEKSISLKKNYAPPFNNIGALHLKNNEYAKALAAFEKAESLSRNSLTPTYNLSQVYLNFGIVAKAKAGFSKIERAKGGDPGVLNGLATSYLFEGNVSKAIQYYEQINPTLFERASFGINYAVALKLGRQNDKAQVVIRSVDVTDKWEAYYKRARNFVEGR